MAADRILILDDEHDLGEMLVHFATDLGLEAAFTASPTEFIARVQDWRPDFIMIDLVMPEIDGLGIMAKLEEVGCDAKVIIMSGMGRKVLESAATSATGRGLAVVGTLIKPFSLQSFTHLLYPATRTSVLKNAKASFSDSRDSFVAVREDIERGIEKGEFVVWYQPKVALGKGRLVGAEALVRWNHPQHGWIPPDRFIPFAETSGLIDVLTDCIVEQAVSWMAKDCSLEDIQSTNLDLFDDEPITASLSINMSARTLSDPNFVDRLETCCARHRVDNQRIILELTETSAMEDPVTSLEMLTRLRLRGFRLSIDDFGTGYSSMNQLVRLPFSELKIDKSFVSTANESQQSRSVVKSVVDLGHSLGLIATAEGVEDRLTLDFLTEIGCDLAQGYFIGRPMPADAFQLWVSARSAPSLAC